MKIASRYLLPVEIMAAVIMLSWGIAGWLGRESLWKMLDALGLNDEWGLLFCGVGGLQLTAACVEMIFGLHWSPLKLFYMVTIRFWLAFCAMAVWTYACYAILVMPAAPHICSLAIQAPALFLCSLWIAYGNRKVSTVLDPSVPTRKLQREILEQRRRGWSTEEERGL